MKLPNDEPLVYTTSNNVQNEEIDREDVQSLFDNSPHITFAVLRFPDKRWFAILNLFGIESTVNLFNLPDEITSRMQKNEGVVMLIHATKGKSYSIYSLKDYLSD